MSYGIRQTIAKVLFDESKEKFTAGIFTEKTGMAPSKIKDISVARKGKSEGHEGIVTNFSEIYVPDNTVAVTFSKGKVEKVWQESSVYFVNEPLKLETPFDYLVRSRENKYAFSCWPEEEKRIVYVNLREIGDITFETGVVPYFDQHYQMQLNIQCKGRFSVQITEPERFITGFVPAGAERCEFSSEKTTASLVDELTHSLMIVMSRHSVESGIKELTLEVENLFEEVLEDKAHVGSWEERFGFRMTGITLEHIRYTEESAKQVEEFNKTLVPFRALEDISEETSKKVFRFQFGEGMKEGKILVLQGLIKMREENKITDEAFDRMLQDIV